jgi:adenylate kinase family enzyme
LLNFWAFNSLIIDQSIGDELLRTLFRLCPEVNYIFWVCVSSVSPPEYLETTFTKLNLSKRSHIPDNDPYKKLAVFYLHRSKILGQLQVRSARVEDNDDLLPILQTSNPNIANGQEDYFLANLISSQNESSKFFVGVYKNRPVGMLATSLDINAELLARVFALDLYPGLIIQPEHDSTIRPHVTLLLGDPNVIRSLELLRLTKHTNTVWINGLKLKETVSNPNQITATEYIALIRNAIQKSSSTSGGNSVKGFIITDCPRNEHDARALLTVIREQRLMIDIVIEIEPMEDDENEDLLMQGEHDVVGEYLDAIELLRDPFTSTDAPLTSTSANHEFLQLHIEWKKIEDDGSGIRSASKLTDILILELKYILTNYLKENEEMLRANQIGPRTNAYAISLFSIDEKFESRSEDLIRVAFEEYSDKDYCILMIPNHRIPSQALVHSMLCPKLRHGVSFDQTLYLIHRHSLYAHDTLVIQRIQTNLSNHHFLQSSFIQESLDLTNYQDFLNCLTRSLRDQEVDLANNPAEVSFEIVMNDNLIGIICLSRKLTTSDDILTLRENYLLDEMISYERHRSRSQAMITYFILNPIYYKWSRFIYREVMRFYHKTVLYYQGGGGGGGGGEMKGSMIIGPIVEEMIPIQRRKKEYAKPVEIMNEMKARERERERERGGEGEGEGEEGESKSQKNMTSHSSNTDHTMVQCNRPLFVLLKKDLSKTKEVIGKRVVVIGGSAVAFKILESLCFASGKHLNNLYLVMESSPSAWVDDRPSLPDEEEDGDGDESHRHRHHIKDNYSGCLSPKDIDDYTENELFALGLPNRVTLIQGKLTDIDRKNRAVIISDEVIVEYDVLVLAAGCQGEFPSLHPHTHSLSLSPHPYTHSHTQMCHTNNFLKPNLFILMT